MGNGYIARAQPFIYYSVYESFWCRKEGGVHCEMSCTYRETSLNLQGSGYEYTDISVLGRVCLSVRMSLLQNYLTDFDDTWYWGWRGGGLHRKLGEFHFDSHRSATLPNLNDAQIKFYNSFLKSVSSHKKLVGLHKAKYRPRPH